MEKNNNRKFIFRNFLSIIAEMVRFGVYFGGKKSTYLGLTGIGDLMVTCNSYHSRNFTAGLQIGKDNSAVEFLKENKRTVEG